MNGFYVALEGGDGAGKTTVASRLAQLLREQGRDVLLVREPGGTALGEEVRRLLLHASEMPPWAEALLFAAQRAQLVADVIGPGLAQGKVVVSDRSLYSSLAYQGGARGLGVEVVRQVNLLAVGGLVPDLVAVLAVDPLVALGRQSAADRIGSEDRSFQEKVAATFSHLAQIEPERVVIVRVGDDVDETARSILALVEERNHG